VEAGGWVGELMEVAGRGTSLFFVCGLGCVGKLIEVAVRCTYLFFECGLGRAAEKL